MQDLSNYTYSGWLGAVAGMRYNEVRTTNQEVQGDMVEAALGLCYLASVFPKQFFDILPQPNTHWRRLETSLLSGKGEFHPRNSGAKTRRSKSNVSWANSDVIGKRRWHTQSFLTVCQITPNKRRAWRISWRICLQCHGIRQQQSVEHTVPALRQRRSRQLVLLRGGADHEENGRYGINGVTQ